MHNSLATSEEIVSELNFYLAHKNEVHVKSVLDVPHVLGLSNEQNSSVFISFVNNALQTRSNRSKGFELLSQTLLHIPPSLVQQNGITWVNYCLNSKEALEPAIFLVLAQVIAVCKDNQDFSKSFLAIRSKVVEMCLLVSPSSSIVKHSLECLHSCIVNYPSTFVPLNNKTEAYLLKFLSSSPSKSVIETAGSCFHYLQQTGISGSNGINYKKNWTTKINKLCSTTHKLYEKFLENVTEYNSYSTDLSDAVEFDESFPSTETSLYVTANCLRNVVTFLNMMLVKKYSVEKMICLETVINVIKRGLEIDVYDDSKQPHFLLLLYEHQVDLLYLLRSLIACFRHGLLRFSFDVSKLLTDCLQRTNNAYFKTSSKYQEAVHKVLNVWITTISNKFQEQLYKKLLSCILSQCDASEGGKAILLNEAAAQSKSSKAKKRSVEGRILKSASFSADNVPEKDKEAHARICTSALTMTHNLLQNVYLDLDPKLFKKLHSTLIKQLLNVQAGRALHPYTESDYKIGLYRALAGLIMQPSFCKSPIIQIATRIFVGGRNLCCNNREEIFRICTEALNVLEKVAQPMLPSLQLDELPATGYKKVDGWNYSVNTKDTRRRDSDDGNFDDANFDDAPLTQEKVEIKFAETSVPSLSKKIQILNVEVILPQVEVQQEVNRTKELVGEEPEVRTEDLEMNPKVIVEETFSNPKEEEIDVGETCLDEVKQDCEQTAQPPVSAGSNGGLNGTGEDEEMLMLRSFKDEVVNY